MKAHRLFLDLFSSLWCKMYASWNSACLCSILKLYLATQLSQTSSHGYCHFCSHDARCTCHEIFHYYSHRDRHHHHHYPEQSSLWSVYQCLATFKSHFPGFGYRRQGGRVHLKRHLLHVKTFILKPPYSIVNTHCSNFSPVHQFQIDLDEEVCSNLLSLNLPKILTSRLKGKN